jgi:type II secretory pathway pseudopilin PulG
MATLAILAAVILPALAKSGDNGMRTVCLNNLRQMGMALNMYVGENQDYMPWPNWGADASPPCPRGWLYSPHPNTPNNLNIGPPIADAANWPTGRVANLKNGVYWQYLQNPDVFMCPLDVLSVGTVLWDERTMKLSTYIMNGASAFYPPFVNTYGYKTCKMSQIWSPLCIINWEPDGTAANGGAGAFAYNDGSSYPDPKEGIGRLHVTGAHVLAVGGSARFMSFADYVAEVNHNAKGDASKGKGLFWWNPLRADGHGNSM